MSIMTKLDNLSPDQKDRLNAHLEDFLEKSQKEEICIYHVGLNPEKSTHPLENFHALYAFLHLENDSYFVLGRADHFVVEIGYTEADYSDSFIFNSIIRHHTTPLMFDNLVTKSI